MWIGILTEEEAVELHCAERSDRDRATTVASVLCHYVVWLETIDASLLFIYCTELLKLKRPAEHVVLGLLANLES